ncbi:MAG: mannose-1-phosphate guanylyltransferase/mannose-6-phosphate isomerase [Inquilinaceae bacterium]
MNTVGAGDVGIVPVILTGGRGTRLWPLSRDDNPKQFLPIAGPNTLFQDTVRRIMAAEAVRAPLIVGGDDSRFVVAEQLRTLGVEVGAVVLEPMGRNTAPAVAAAARLICDRMGDAVMVILPSDHLVLDEDAFRSDVAVAATAARAGKVVTIGIPATTPETGYGYIQQGAALDGLTGTYEVVRFVEKPPLSDAQGYVADGSYRWNSGMFVVTASTLLRELDRLSPAVSAGAAAAVAGATVDADFMRLEADSFGGCPDLSIDYAVMEHTDRAAMVPASFGWSDVGSWSSLWDVAARDTAGNAAVGNTFLKDVRNAYVRSEDGQLIAVIGVDDIIVVGTREAVLVIPKSRAQEVKDVVQAIGKDR